jgi:hypothetical protein
MKVGDKLRTIRDHWCEPLFDEGWWVRKGMIGSVYALDQGNGEIAIDFGETLDRRKRKGWVVPVVPQDAIELVSK